jgi:hypothetical protein
MHPLINLIRFIIGDDTLVLILIPTFFIVWIRDISVVV